ncbi:hypothetical protein HPB50_010455 [Hyalomma asiaticum]|uniref:Uncharacterized protein n=1 Tax=Hyalomma asiaticum TaxID=266040 RepID=A0ACB7TG28_HYAAI|nr:hypothetical protein HPB50_010455 [Hyalomma asiaticum]
MAPEPAWRADVKLSGARRLAAHLTELWWGRCLNEVRIRSKTEGKMSGSRGFVAFGDVVIPEEVADVLNKGPRYSYEPAVPAHDLLALNRSVSNKACQEAQERCLLEGVGALKKTVNTKVTRVAKDPTKRVVSFFEENNLRLLQADKTGGFLNVYLFRGNTSTPAIAFTSAARSPNAVHVKPCEIANDIAAAPAFEVPRFGSFCELKEANAVARTSSSQ